MIDGARVVTVGLVQVAELSWNHRTRRPVEIVDGVPVPKLTGGQQANVPFTYLPLAVGSLQAYAQKKLSEPDRVRFLTPIHRRMPVDEALEGLAGADLVAFSCYVWNVNLSLAIAQRLKEVSPSTCVVFGGPQVPDNAEDFLRRNAQIDLACHGEGEAIFVAVLERFRQSGSGEWGDVPSISWIDRGGIFHTNPRRLRLVDLSVLPSPYLEGAFDDLMAKYPAHKWLALWETNRGCPFSCSFCDWGSAVGSKVARFPMERLQLEIDWFASHGIANLFVCDANFGMLRRDLDLANLLVDRYERASTPLAISVQNTKNSPERAYAIQKALTSSKLVTFGVTLSMQSLSAPVLTAIRRSNISLESFHDIATQYQQDGIDTYTDLIIGLPGETRDSFADGLCSLIERGQHNRIAFYNCSVLPNAEMGDPAYRARYGMQTVPVEIIREHEGLDQAERKIVPEYLETVIATETMPREDWARTRAFAWMVDTLHFDRVLQLLLIVTREASGIGYRALFEALISAPADSHPVLAGLHQFFLGRARENQAGHSDLIASREHLGIWWPADQFAVLELVGNGRLARLYDEAVDVLLDACERAGSAVDPLLLRDAARLNRALFCSPLQFEDLQADVAYNLLEFYQGILANTRIPLRAVRRRYLVDRTTTAWTCLSHWCEDVVVQVYDRGAFLYPAYRIDHLTGDFDDEEEISAVPADQ